MPHSRKHGRGHRPDQYSHEYHLSRAVQCQDCGCFLHKDHHYVLYGNRCYPCYQAVMVAQGNGRLS